MKAAIVEQAGALPVYGNFAEPEAGTGEVIVNVSASALSNLTRGRAAGSHYSVSGGFPLIAGVDGTGRLADGRRVYFLLPRAPFGAMAERTIVLESHCITVPDTLDDVTAALIANPGMSSWAALTERARMNPGETVLIHGATGASGRLAVKIARHLGAARVIATGRNKGVLESLGADAIVSIGADPDAFEGAIRRHFADGIDIVLDYLWGPGARSILVAGAKAGREGVPIRFVQIGSVAGAEIELPAAALRSSAIEMMGSGIGSVSLAGLLASIDGVFNAAQAANLTLDHVALPLSEVNATWANGGDRIVYLPG